MRFSQLHYSLSCKALLEEESKNLITLKYVSMKGPLQPKYCTVNLNNCSIIIEFIWFAL